MLRHLRAPLLVPDLAARVHLSPARFRHLFRAQTGFAPSQYLRLMRLRRARLLIERTFLTIREVMIAVGYHDPSHFSRDFRRCHGVAPSALRESGIITPFPGMRAVTVESRKVR
jgi:AraC family transcriptional regulator of arabinose operon